MTVRHAPLWIDKKGFDPASPHANSFALVLALPVGGHILNVDFDDLMNLMDDQVMLNHAVMGKFGIRLGEVTLSFRRRPQ
jgi:hypothetical protein